MEDDPRSFGLFRHATDTVSFRAGSVVFSQGDEARCMYAIQSGRLEIRIGEKALATLGEGEVFGEMALLNDKSRSATVVALEDSVLVPVDQTQFLFLVRQNPFFALQLMRLLSERLRDRNPLTPLSSPE